MADELDWNDLKFFLAVHRSHTIRSAAHTLQVSHSTVSRRTDALERSLNTRLFDRFKDGFVLTEAGEQILERAERVEAELSGIQRELVGRDTDLSGRIKITMPPPVSEHLMMEPLFEFQKLYPEIDLEVDSSYTRSDLSRRDADIALRIHSPPEDHLLGRRLPDFAEAVYVSHEYAKQHTFQGKEATANWIGWGDIEPYPAWVKKSEFPECPVNFESADQLTQLSACKTGFGMAILPCFIGDIDTDLTRVPGSGLYAQRSAWILTHPDLKTTQRVRVCVGFLVEAIMKREVLVSGQHRE